MRAAKNIFANIDKTSIFLYIMLILFGWLNIYASQYNDDISFNLDLTSRYGKQALFILISCFTGFLILIIDWKFFYSLTYFLYFVIILLLIIVLLKGNVTSGATSWFNIGTFKFQPSEFAKFATALALAKYYNNIHIKKLIFIDKIKTFKPYK